jgi:hypothetical protein
MHVATADELREYVRRDWRLVEQVKDEFWMDRRRRLRPIDALRIADALRAQVRAIRSDWPTPADRAADLTAHRKVVELLGRAAPATKR